MPTGHTPTGEAGQALRALMTDAPEGVAWALFQEDAGAGPIDAWRSVGFRPIEATQAEAAARPMALEGGGGVLFRSGSVQNLTWPWDNESTVLHRWGVLIARCDLRSARSRGEVHAMAIHKTGGGSAYAHPYIGFDAAAGTMFVQWFDTEKRRVGGRCAGDFATWNVLVWNRRAQMLHASVNGAEAMPAPFVGPSRNKLRTPSFLGRGGGANPADMAIDCVIMGQGEVTDAFHEKLVGAAMRRAGRLADLPGGHPWKSRAPEFSDDDYHTRFEHDAAEWEAFTEGSAKSADDPRFAFRGAPEPSHEGYVPVFSDDFLTDTVVRNIPGKRRGAWPGANWFAPYDINPGANVNNDARNAELDGDVPVYAHDGSGTGSFKIRLLNHKGHWWSGSIGTSDHSGNGRWFAPPLMREMRFRFNVPSVKGGFFPAFWSYSRDKYQWRTRSPVEMDDWEADGKDPSWINTTLHVHNPDAPGTFVAPNQTDDIREKVAGYQVDEANGFPFGMNWYDGAWHVVKLKVEADLSTVYVDGREVSRFRTVHPLANRFNTIINFALVSSWGELDPSETYEMEIDYVKYWKPESALAAVPPAFKARPTISGAATVGSVLVCDPRIEANQCEFRWYRSDGTPIAGETGNGCPLTAAEAGLGVRCHVRAVSLKDQPEAWTALTAAVA